MTAGAAWGGRQWSRPTMSRTLSMNWGSFDSLNVDSFHGLRPNAFQMRTTAVCVIPVERAMSRVDQCDAPFGVSSNVFTMTRSTWSSVMLRGAPGRGSSTRPSRRSSTKRRRHFPTAAWLTPSSAATCLLSDPPAQANTIFDRRANDCGVFGRRAHRSRVVCSSSFSTRGPWDVHATPCPHPTRAA